MMGSVEPAPLAYDQAYQKRLAQCPSHLINKRGDLGWCWSKFPQFIVYLLSTFPRNHVRYIAAWWYSVLGIFGQCKSSRHGDPKL